MMNLILNVIAFQELWFCIFAGHIHAGASAYGVEK